MDPLRRLSAAERFARARELRHNPTPAERHAWTLLRNRGILRLKFRRQHVLHGFIVDFYCPSERIVIELEGNVHDTEAQRGYDQARTGLLEGAGYRVIRVRNRDASRLICIDAERTLGCGVPITPRLSQKLHQTLGGQEGRRVCELDASDGRARERCRDA